MEYDTVWLQNRPSPVSVASLTITAVVVLATLSSAESVNSDGVTADVWIAGAAVVRHTAATSEIHVPLLCIVNAISLCRLLCCLSLK